MTLVYTCNTTSIRKYPKANMRANWFKIVFLYLNRDTELAQAVDITMVTSKENLNFDDQSKQVVFLFFTTPFSNKMIKHVLCVSIQFCIN